METDGEVNIMQGWDDNEDRRMGPEGCIDGKRVNWREEIGGEA